MNAPHRRAPRWRLPLAIALLLGAASGLGAWFIAAPLRATPARVVPEPDLDARQAGASPTDRAVAAQASSPSTLIATSAAASAAQDERARCGFDQEPEATDPPADPDGVVRELPQLAKPGGVGYAGAQRRADAALRSTGDPFDAAVADALNIGELRSMDDRLVALGTDAAQGSDPRLYELAVSACFGVESQPAFEFRNVSVAGPRGIDACARLDPRRWASLDPGNAVPWIHVLARADKSGDAAAQREALERLASSMTYELRSGAAAASIARLPLASEVDLGGVSALMMQATSFELLPPIGALTTRCMDRAHGDTAMATTCERIGSALGGSRELDGLVLGAALHKQATGDARLWESLRKERNELDARWQSADTTLMNFEKAPCDAAHALRHFDALVGTLGRRAAMLQELARLNRAAASAGSR